MKTTPEIPDELFRQAKAAAALKRIPLQEFVSEALAEKLKAMGYEHKPWMESFGQLRGLRAENARISRLIEEEFSRIEPEDLL